jgi:YegS/Rv2252/BmrU family lipid kinase
LKFGYNQSVAEEYRMPNAMLIFNPVAGRYPSRLLTERAAAVLNKQGWKVEIETSKKGEDFRRLSSQAAMNGMDAVIVVGGDGSINHAVAGLIGTDTALGVLPAGTANVWAQELGLPGLSWTRWIALEESARRLANCQIRKVDVGFCNDAFFLLWAGVGLDAFIVHHIEPRKQWEKHFAFVQYFASAVWNASVWHGLNLRVMSGEKEIGGHFMLAVASNVSLYAGGLATLSPGAMVDDGLMDLWLFEGENLEDTFRQAWDLWSGRHVQSNRVRCISFEEVTLLSDSNMYIQMDGEPDAGGGKVDIRVLPRALNVLVPEGAPQQIFSKKSTGMVARFP